MSSKIMQLALKINATLGDSFNSRFAEAVAKIGDVKKEILACQKVSEHMQKAMQGGIINPKVYANAQAQMAHHVDMLKYSEASTKMAQSGANMVQFWNMGKQIIRMTDTAADFEAKMSKVGAITNSSSVDIENLTNKARELGATTQFSATQAAEAMSYLGMAGWDAKKIMAGMPGLLNLAAAGGTDLARTADIISDDLTAFGLAADKASHMADVFAYTITHSNTNVEMLGDTMKYAAPVAHAFGASMEETAALAGLMANSGIKASQAGTALRSGFLRLAGPPKMAAKAMAELGMSMSDINNEQKEALLALKSLGINTGNLEGSEKMVHILTELKNKTANLGKEEKLASLKAIFGTEAATGWLAVLEQGPAEFDKFVKALKASSKDGGAAAKMAEKMQNNARGASIKLKSALESLSISIGGTLLPVIAEWGQRAAELTGSISKFASEHPVLVSYITSTALGMAALGTAGNALMWVYRGISLTITGMQAAYSGVIAFMTKYQVLTRSATILQWVWNASLFGCPLVWIIGGLAGLAAIIAICYNHCDEFRLRWTMAWVEFQSSYPKVAAVFEGIWKLISAPYRLVCAFIDKVKELIGLGPTAAEKFAKAPAHSNNPNDYEHNATGGIYGKGAFLTTFAENSGESAIPHTPNARNIGLLAKTNEIMGSPLGGNSISVNFSPTVNVSGGADASAVQSAIADERRKLETMLKDLMNQQRRVSYA